jgi:hypothetical protein
VSENNPLLPHCLYQDVVSSCGGQQDSQDGQDGAVVPAEQQPFLCTPFNPWTSVIQTENDQDMAVHPPDERPHPGHPGHPFHPGTDEKEQKAIIY